MKVYMDYSGKGRWSSFWGDKVKPKFKRIFKKSARQSAKRQIIKDINE